MLSYNDVRQAGIVACSSATVGLYGCMMIPLSGEKNLVKPLDAHSEHGILLVAAEAPTEEGDAND